MHELESFGLVLQIGGLLVILASQIWLLYRVRRKRRSLKEAFVSLASPKEGLGDRLDHTLGKINDKEFLKRFPLAKFLYDDFVISVFGVALALVGTVFELMG